jgi:GNAT superfamily N-acetyltransferase
MRDRSITIRAARADDLAAIGAIVAASWRHTFAGLLPSEVLLSITPEAQRMRHERSFGRKGVRYRVACVADTVVGFASRGPGRDPELSGDHELYAIYLMPDHERRGIGKRLFEASKADAAADVCNTMYLTALSLNPNLAFYDRLGGERFAAKPLTLGARTYAQVGFRWPLATEQAGPTSAL